MPENEIYPVFYNPSRKRWISFKFWLVGISSILVVILIILIFSVIASPSLNILNFNNLNHNKGHTNKNQSVSRTNKPKSSILTQNINSDIKKLNDQNSSNIVTKPSNTDNERISMGYFVNWDPNSFISLKNNLDNLDMLVPEWLHLDSSSVISEDDHNKAEYVTHYVRERKPNLKIVPLINNYNSKGEWDQDLLKKYLGDINNKNDLINSLLNYVESNGLDGLNVDFEDIPEDLQDSFVDFLSKLHSQFQSKKWTLTVNVPADDDSFLYAKIADSVDYEIVMAYDEHFSASQAGAIASIDWFNMVLENLHKEIPANKLIIAMGTYGYDWTKDKKEAETLTFQEAVRLAQESEGEVVLDQNDLNSYFGYVDENNVNHDVWFLDAPAMFNEMKLVNQYNLAGYAVWRLGGEDPSVWEFYGQKINLDQNLADKFKTVNYQGIDYEGEGDILKVTEQAKSGQRNVIFNKDTGLISESKFEIFPTPYQITAYGLQSKKIALTFDDGPDPQYTPTVLDVLKEKNAKATFFVVGSQAQSYPDIVKRIYDEGNDIGSHTYTHPNISQISSLQLDLELSITQRLISSITDHGTHLFRSPYSEDENPSSKAELDIMNRIDELGYIFVGTGIDSSDWKERNVDSIVDSVVSQAVENQSNTVLLHDAGGDRSKTLLALPKIIDKLRENGYELVTVSELLKKSPNEIMPLNDSENIVVQLGNKTGFSTITLISQVISILSIIGIVLGSLRLLFVIILALIQKFKRKTKFTNFHGSVAVIIPAYNESKVILQTIESILHSKLPDNCSIIVVDDGSKDDTYEKVKSAYGSNPLISCFKIANGGKSNALNFGITHTEADIVICLDADTIFSKDCILNLIRHFNDEEIGAVAGNAKVGNRINLITKWQALEYITSQNLDRRAFDQLNCITVVPGAVGAWRTDIVKRIGGFHSDTLAEDADLTVRILSLGYKILYEEDAIAYTEAPDSIKTLIKQRRRWVFGTLQMAFKHKDAIFKYENKLLGWIAIPNILIFQIFFPLVSPLFDFILIFSTISTIWAAVFHPTQFSAENFTHVLLSYSIFVGLDFLAALIAFLLENKEDKSLLLWLFFQRFLYRQILYIVAIQSILSSIKGEIEGWGKLDRKGTVSNSQI